ncbi:MAG: hypothetical protein G01um101470_249 [Parcubacteria group bacterium Gr01-1014_70]|nr:MAG: hypothetical protein G01um101470_249 [Parcubacteria group bacterium Gr01-1014_70]
MEYNVTIARLKEVFGRNFTSEEIEAAYTTAVEEHKTELQSRYSPEWIQKFWEVQFRNELRYFQKACKQLAGMIQCSI